MIGGLVRSRSFCCQSVRASAVPRHVVSTTYTASYSAAVGLRYGSVSASLARTAITRLKSSGVMNSVLTIVAAA